MNKEQKTASEKEAEIKVIDASELPQYGVLMQEEYT